MSQVLERKPKTEQESEDEFYARHAAGGPSNVVLVHLYVGGEFRQVGLFSVIEKARTWVDGIEDDVHALEISAIFVPYIIDDPDWGNRVVQ